MVFREFKDKWDNIPNICNGYLNLGITHPLNLQMGYSTNIYKSFIVMDTGVISSIPSSFAVKAVNTQLGNGKWILEFQLIHHSFEEEFLRLCWDMIEATVNADKPLDELILRYLSWQKFLQYTCKNIMSFQKQKGLLGELLYLKAVMKNTGNEEALIAWSGPDGSDQDFLFSDSWAEIKSIALASESVHISSLQQLEQEMPGTIVVNILEKSTKGDGRVTLPDIVEDMRKELRDTPRLLDCFEMKLFKYGYRDEDVEEYRENYFRFIEQRKYLVGDSFPRLVRNNVFPEIVSCKYEVSLSAIEKFRRE